MTERNLYDAALIEINKLEAPSMLLEDYNYLINKAIQQKVNKSYNLYEINQQATDDLLALKCTAVLDVLSYNSEELASNFKFIPNEVNNYYSNVPSNYWHMLNCVIQFAENKDSNKCSNKNKSLATVARKLTSDLYPSIINNAYLKPSPQNPYYRIIKNHTDDISDALSKMLYPCVSTLDVDKAVNNILNPGDKPDHDYILDIRCGDTDRYEPKSVYIDYLKTPNIIMLSQEDLESREDNTSEMEFPDYVCYEIINEFVKLLLENASDPRLQTNIPINQTIGIPTE